MVGLIIVIAVHDVLHLGWLLNLLLRVDAVPLNDVLHELSDVLLLCHLLLIDLDVALQ